MNYIGACDNTFPFPIGDESLAPNLYHFDGCCKVWFVVLTVDKKKFEELLATKIFSSNYTNIHEGGIGQVLAMKSTMHDAYTLGHTDSTLKITKVVQSYRHFIILAPRAHHDGYNTG